MGKWWRQRKQFFVVVVVVVCPTFLIYHLGANPLSPAKLRSLERDICTTIFRPLVILRILAGAAAGATIDQDDKLNIARWRDDL